MANVCRPHWWRSRSERFWRIVPHLFEHSGEVALRGLKTTAICAKCRGWKP